MTFEKELIDILQDLPLETQLFEGMAIVELKDKYCIDKERVREAVEKSSIGVRHPKYGWVILKEDFEKELGL